MSETFQPEHGYAYVDDGEGGVLDLENVAEVEPHPTADEVCVTFEDGRVEFYETDFWEVE